MAWAISFCCGVSFVVERREPGERVGDAAAGRQRDVLAGDLDAQRLGPEAGAVADLARLRRLVAAELLAHPRALGLEHAAVEVADHALERLLDLVAALAVDEAEGDRAAAGAVEDDVLRLLGQVLPRHVRGRNRRRGRGWTAPACNKGWAAGLGPGDDRALGDREVVVGDDEVLVEDHLLAEAVAGRAGALRRVEAEQPRLDLGDGEAARPGRRIFRRRGCGRATP